MPSAAPISCLTYDGDTPQDARRAIRERANVVLTNPDMLHTGILPHHTKWAKLFENLRYIVIDELHLLSRRLRQPSRQCPAPPAAHLRVLRFEAAIHLLLGHHRQSARTGRRRSPASRSNWSRENGAPSGEKYFVFYNPPVVNRQLGIRRSYLHETRRIALEFIRQNQQTLVFANNRLATEILTTYLKDACSQLPFSHEAVRGYRGGYLPRERREIEQRAARRRDPRRGGDQRARTRHRYRLAR